MESINTLEAMGYTLPSPAYLLGAIFFGIVGYVAYRHGKKTGVRTTKWLGVALMLFPYAVSATWLLYIVGAGLCASVYLSRR